MFLFRIDLEPSKSIALGAALIIVPFVMIRQSPENKAAKRVREDVSQVESRLPKEGGLPEVEQFAAHLQAIATNEAPLLVREALAKYIRMLQTNATVRREGGNTNQANDEVAAAKKEFVEAVVRLEPY